jgi:hypothetical protein
MSDNCWKTTASAAAACLPPASETGTLSADGATCTYASGAVVSFTPPIVLPFTNSDTWNFTVSNGGQTCLHFESSPAKSLKLVVEGQTFTETENATAGVLIISCPGGTSVATTNPLALLSCGAGTDGGASFGGLPGYSDSYSDTSLGFGLLNTSTDSSISVPVFACSR